MQYEVITPYIIHSISFYGILHIVYGPPAFLLEPHSARFGSMPIAKLTTGREIASRRRLKKNQKPKSFHFSTVRDFSTFPFSGHFSTFRDFSTFRFSGHFSNFRDFSFFWSLLDCSGLFDFSVFWSPFDFSGLSDFSFFCVTFGLFGTFRLFGIFDLSFFWSLSIFRDFSTFPFCDHFSTFRDFWSF